MKKSFIICAALCFVLSFPLFSQDRTAFHYPLNDGDLWEYEESSGGLRFRVIRKVLGDTLLPTGNTYKVIRYSHPRDSEYLLFQRVANNVVYQYPPRFVRPDSVVAEEVVIFNLEVAVGDSWPYSIGGVSNKSCFYRVEEIGVLDFANRAWKKAWFKIITFSDSSLCTGYIEFSDSLGIHYEGYENVYYELCGAIINGQQFGTLTSVNVREAAATSLIPSVRSFRILPNPVVSEAQIQFELNRPSEIQFFIFDVLGRQLYQSPRHDFGVGFHSWSLNGMSEFIKTSIPNGVYFVVLNEKLGQRLVRKFTAMK